MLGAWVSQGGLGGLNGEDKLRPDRNQKEAPGRTGSGGLASTGDKAGSNRGRETGQATEEGAAGVRSMRYGEDYDGEGGKRLVGKGTRTVAAKPGNKHQTTNPGVPRGVKTSEVIFDRFRQTPFYGARTPFFTAGEQGGKD